MLNNEKVRLCGVVFSGRVLSIRKNLTFVVGLRSDWHERYENTLGPRVGSLLAQTPNTAIRANYSWAFRDPNSFEREIGAGSYCLWDRCGEIQRLQSFASLAQDDEFHNSHDENLRT
jgi:hypothetical protein